MLMEDPISMLLPGWHTYLKKSSVVGGKARLATPRGSASFNAAGIESAALGGVSAACTQGLNSLRSPDTIQILPEPSNVVPQ